ncbi:MAG: YigZ family protein [Acutalibacteraceae bacterium]|nr:YigZ family protein [Acutalibacteraceae bacterium]
MASYKTVKKESYDEFIEKKSRFIGYVKPVKTVDEAVAFVNEIKSKHWDATHNVYAYSLREGQVKRFSDDGEPQGTAGIPTLDVILKQDVVDCCVVVTRYFGGIMLGAGGLVRAYSHGAKIALDAGEVITMSLCKIVKVRADYNFYGRLVPLICEEGGIVEDTQFTDNVEVTFRIPEEKVPFFQARLTDVSNGRFFSEVIDEKYCEV